MKRLLFALLLQGCAGCVAGYNPGTPAPEYCDADAVDWGDPECTVVEAQGTYRPDYRYVCPQADGTEWELRISHTQSGEDVKLRSRYTVVPGVTPHVMGETLCTVWE